MAIKKEIKENALMSAIGQILVANPDIDPSNTGSAIVDIMTFCDDPRFLNLPANNFSLWPSQRIILKCFYMGTLGNENLKLTPEEWDWLKNNQEDEVRDEETYEKNIKDVLNKLMLKEQNPGSPGFSELQLVLGRRSGKSIMASVITVYEAYKLLVINDGDPQRYYDLPDGDEISILNVALSQMQAGVLFTYIQDRLRQSPFFRHRISDPTADEIRLLTDRDIAARKDKSSALLKKGSIVLRCGHSNPDSLAGRSAILILFDEIAFYDETSKTSGEHFYGRLTPSLANFYKRGHAKIVQISSPNNRAGIFWKTFEASKNTEKGNNILSFQLPTWCVNPRVSYDLPEMQQSRLTNPEGFKVEFGAQWASGGTFGNFFEPAMIERCIRGGIGPHTRQDPKYNYYMHIDPAKNANNYCAVLIARERYTDYLGKRRAKCILAGLWVWRPLPNLGLQFHLIDREVLRICQIFRPNIVTYDDYHSVHSLQFLRSHGVNTHQLSYNRNVKMKIYQNLRDLMAFQPEPELNLFDNGGDSSLLIQELIHMKYKRTQRGFTLVVDKGSDVKTDDLADCLAGACASANETTRMALPEPVVVYSALM